MRGGDLRSGVEWREGENMGSETHGAEQLCQETRLGRGRMAEAQAVRVSTHPLCAGSGKNEFVNIGVVLRAAEGEQSMLRFTRDWGRVRCLDPDADTQMLEALEIEIGHRLRAQPADHPRPIMAPCSKIRSPTGYRSPRPRLIWRRPFWPAWKI